jgi:type II secretory ATPase GspE/PulE/Tfp pilus assembly ATPase PilB-like protein
MDQSRQGNQIPQRTVPNDGVFLAADNEPNSGGAVAANDQDLPVESQQNPSANSLESLSERYNLLPWEPTRTACSLEAEVLVKKLGRAPHEPHPWIPVATAGPLLIFGHHDPAAMELWGVPEFLTIRVVLTPDKYKELYDDLIQRLRINPVAAENAYEFLQPPPPEASLQEIFHWYTENYPLDKADIDRLAQQTSKIQTDKLSTIEDYNAIEKNLGVAFHRISTGEVVFNAEEAPAQMMFAAALLEKHTVFPLHCGKNQIHLLTGDPLNYSFEDEWLSGGNEPVPIKMVVADADAIKRTISRHRSRASADSSGEARPTGELHFADNANMVEIEPSDIEKINPANVNTSPEAIVHWVLYRSILNRASDLHVERYYNMCRFRARIDGKLRMIYSSPDENLNKYIALIKNYSNMPQTRKEAQDGRFGMAIGKRRVDVRVSAVPCRKEAQKLTMRFLDKQDGLKSLKDLSLSERKDEIVTDVMERDQGLVLVTGPTGSGKTTTLYALINSVNSDEKNIHTIEDPIEYEIEGINQTQTDPVHGIDFAVGLRALLRADPDVILIGESRDRETAQAAVNSALTGHLVLTTLHANDCMRAVTRLLSMGVAPYLLADSLAMSQAQRLVRRLCDYCKRPVAASSDLQRILAKQGLIQGPLTNPIFESNGCPECHNSGFHGRTALMEMCMVGPKLQDLISRDRPQSELRQVAAKTGVLTLYQEGLMEVINGTTTLKEISPLSYTAEMEGE